MLKRTSYFYLPRIRRIGELLMYICLLSAPILIFLTLFSGGPGPPPTPVPVDDPAVDAVLADFLACRESLALARCEREFGERLLRLARERFGPTFETLLPAPPHDRAGNELAEALDKLLDCMEDSDRRSCLYEADHFLAQLPQ